MRKNYVLVDYENVQSIDAAAFKASHFHVLVFLGANQSKVSSDLVISMQALGDRGQFIQIAGNGQNALDFHIAYYIGSISAVEPNAYFHIVSKDGGFGPLIAHLKAQKVHAAQHTSAALVPGASTDTATRAHLYETKLRAPNSTKPRTVATLSNSISAFFQKQLSDQELKQVVDKLVASKFIAIEGTKITYP